MSTACDSSQALYEHSLFSFSFRLSRGQTNQKWHLNGKREIALGMYKSPKHASVLFASRLKPPDQREAQHDLRLSGGPREAVRARPLFGGTHLPACVDEGSQRQEERESWRTADGLLVLRALTMKNRPGSRRKCSYYYQTLGFRASAWGVVLISNWLRVAW